MCGIAGQINFLRQDPVLPEVIERMASSISHRGPDDDGFFIDGPVGLGFRRLSIIDLSGGHQPMSDAEESIWVVFNGEIYNYKELRAELENKGHKFRTTSDTEVIVYGYKQWGLDVLDHLNGMFGLAIWDVRRKRLTVARDPMGIKLIYFSIREGCLTFGSEIRAVRAAGKESPEIDPAALNLFLRYRYTPAPYTLFSGIRKLAPGARLVVENGTCREERWYNYAPVPFDPPKSDDDAVEELLDIYKGAVKRHLLSDVPVGILLSGGLDSGLLLALMNEQGKGWPAYTVGYGDAFADDELKDAAETAELLGARHVPVLLSQDEYEKSLLRIVSFLEEPVTSSSIVPMFFVCERARADVKVALIGQGPDELFGGYKRHLGVRYGGLWRGLPSPVRSLVSAGVGLLPRNEALKRGVQSLGTEDRLQRYQDVFCLAPSEFINGLFREGALNQKALREELGCWDELLPHMAHVDELGGLQMIEIRSSLPEELLMFADKLSMAHGLEGRVPYLDRNIVEYVQRLGSNLKVRGRRGKWVHREVCRRFLHPRILARKKKGFAVNVVDGWFKASMGGELPRCLLDHDSLIYRLLKPEPIRKMLEEHQAGRHDHYKLLFSLVMLEQVLRAQR
jgi:asparagine synthase (glutamine-hydrolysing)